LPQPKCAPAARSPVSRRRARTLLCARASSRPSLQLGVPLLRSRSLFLGARVEPSSRHSTAGVAVRGARFLLARAESSTCPRELRAEPPARRPTAEEPIVVRRCSRGAELLGLRPATLQDGRPPRYRCRTGGAGAGWRRSKCLGLRSTERRPASTLRGRPTRVVLLSLCRVRRRAQACRGLATALSPSLGVWDAGYDEHGFWSVEAARAARDAAAALALDAADGGAGAARGRQARGRQPAQRVAALRPRGVVGGRAPRVPTAAGCAVGRGALSTLTG
ncbi:hypothetical protein EMIHUDRAFT_447044, partial [Emiliania huxleyi CCMP1516]